MNLDLTRRTLLHLAGASSLAAAAAQAARAEGNGNGGGPTFASRTPMRIGTVTMRVRKLDTVADFYRDVLGLTVMERTATRRRARLRRGETAGARGASASPSESRKAAGLYHTAFLMPTRKDLARWLVHAALNRVPLSGFADHRVSESIYLDDPEGNGIEVYADRDPSLWQWNDGTVTMGDRPARYRRSRLAHRYDAPATTPARPEGLRIGHIHLRVGDLAQAEGFYRGAIGFDPTRQRNGAAFLSSGRYHHHLALNVWQSAGAGRRDDAATGLAWFSLEIEKPDIFAAQEQRLRQAGVKVAPVANGLEAVDPWGTRVRLSRSEPHGIALAQRPSRAMA